MKINGMLSWGLATLMALGIALPGKAEKNDRGPGYRPQINVREVDEKDDARVFQSWYGHQMRYYDRIDSETGERLSDLIQMVVEVSNKKLLVTDESNLRRGVIITNRTRISRDKEGNGDNRYDNGRKPTSASFHPGDLIIAEGYLRTGGGITATSIRIVGRARGYGNDDYRPGNYGFRTWGEVRSVDVRKGTLVVNINNRLRTVDLDRGAVVIINGKRQSLDRVRRGDRIIVYSRNLVKSGTIPAYRIVVLPDDSRYPEGDRPYHADPDYSDYHQGSAVLEGEFLYIRNGVTFDLMVIHGDNGTEYSVRISKDLQVDRDGRNISPRDLRSKEKIRVFYGDIDGNLFGERLEVK